MNEKMVIGQGSAEPEFDKSKLSKVQRSLLKKLYSNPDFIELKQKLDSSKTWADDQLLIGNFNWSPGVAEKIGNNFKDGLDSEPIKTPIIFKKKNGEVIQVTVFLNKQQGRIWLENNMNSNGKIGRATSKRSIYE